MNFVSYYQIASLKAALVKKDGETEQNSRPSSPEKSRMKTFLSSPSLPSYKSVVEMSVNRTNSLEDVRNAAEVRIVLKINVQIQILPSETQLDHKIFSMKVNTKTRDSRVHYLCSSSSFLLFC